MKDQEDFTSGRISAKMTRFMMLSPFVMIQGIFQAMLIRLPFPYLLSIREGASLTSMGLVVPFATRCGIVMCLFHHRSGRAVNLRRA